MKRLAAFLLAFALAPWAVAADPPGRVGRLGWLEGEVAVFSDPEHGWEPAVLNAHLTGENSVWTEPRARAEVRIGSTALRLGEATQLDIARLDDESLRAHVVRGSLAVRIRYFEKGDSYEITTPEARFQLRGNGRYRIDADAERGESRITVFSGSARLEAAGGFVTVDTGRAVRVTRAASEFEHARTTGLDEWALARDDRDAQREASRYVSPRMTGWEDLDDYGQWRNEPEYGSVWYPTAVDAGWAPYRTGRWTWVRPWGWSWVDDAPWGYAPFHYGRWVFVGNRWGWYPGRYTPRPVWAPALVGWVGSPGWSLTISANPATLVGWYPLSPFDNYRPWYPANTTYVNHINRFVIVDRRPHREYVNRDYGATVVTRDIFASQRPVHRNLAPVPREVVAAQPIHNGSGMLPARNEWRARTPQGTPTQAPQASVPSVTANRPYPGVPAPRPAPQAVPSAAPAASATPWTAPANRPQPSSAPAPTPGGNAGSAPSSSRPITVPSPSPAQQFVPPAQQVMPPAQQFVPPAASGSPRPARPVPASPAPSAAPSGPFPPSSVPPAPAQAPTHVTKPSYDAGARPAQDSRERREARPVPSPQVQPSNSWQAQPATPPQASPRSQPQNATPSPAVPRPQPQQAAPSQPKPAEKPAPKQDKPPKPDQHSGG